jgi:hypothetical protein
MARVRQVEAWIEKEEAANERDATDVRGGSARFISPAFTTLISRWLDLADPQIPANSSAMRQARRICGRWVAHRRRALNMGVDRLAALIAVDAEAVHLLELGLAGEDNINTEARRCLSAALAGAAGGTWAASVIDVAVGRCDAHAQDVAQFAAAAIRSGEVDQVS